jgi:tetratricopeptide (TPR) repeat protein
MAVPSAPRPVPRAGRRRKAAASCFLTAAALQLAATLPGTTDAFAAPSSSACAARRCGVDSASSSTFTSTAASTALRMAAGLGCSPHSSRRASAGTIAAATPAQLLLANASASANGGNFPRLPPPVSVGSTVVPSTAFLSSPPRERAGLSIPGAATKYGGRALGSGSSSSSSSHSGAGGALVTSSRGSLGFVVVDDIPSAPAASAAAARTRLAVSRSVPGQADRVDASFFGGGGDGDDLDLDLDIGIVDADAATSSPVRRRVAESLRRNAADGNGNDKNKKDKGDTSVKAAKAVSPPSTVPAWFPWIPTRSQIETLQVPELRDACGERGLAKVRTVTSTVDNVGALASFPLVEDVAMYLYIIQLYSYLHYMQLIPLHLTFYLEQMGRKPELQERLISWTTEQHQRRVANRRSGLPSGIRSRISAGGSATPTSNKRHRTPLDDMIEDALEAPRTPSRPLPTSATPSGDGMENLFNRRKALREAKDGTGLTNDGEEDDENDNANDDAVPTEEYLSQLAETFNFRTAKFSNFEVREMYQKAKHADQAGDRRLAKKILAELLEATPKDSRILRRLSRMEVEEGNISGARQILQNGIRSSPGDANLLHGLATLESKYGSIDAARSLYKDAIRADPSQPNAYHAFGTMEHSSGNIRVATTVLRHGIKHCPTNHRLHHALGDLYREAQMLDLSELAYQKALKHSPEWGKSFAFTALSYLAYDKGERLQCRRWLQESLEVEGTSHSQGWLALAQLEESDGRIEAARRIYDGALSEYEKSRTKKWSQSKPYRPSRSGDKWIFVYKSWARMEEHHGTFRTANAVYARATKAYRNHSVLYLGWAKLHAKHGRDDRARHLFKVACDKGGGRSAEPYREFAEFEMARGDHARAKSILYLGAQQLSEATDVAPKGDELAHLYYTWALCEWHLENYERTEKLFDQALRMTNVGEKGSDARSIILHSLARFFYEAKSDYILAQHSICLALKETVTPGRYPQMWSLWAEISEAQGNDGLARSCRDQLAKDTIDAESSDMSSSSLPMMTAPAMRNMLRKAPWFYKLAGVSEGERRWLDTVALPQGDEETDDATFEEIEAR